MEHASLKNKEELMQKQNNKKKKNTKDSNDTCNCSIFWFIEKSAWICFINSAYLKMQLIYNLPYEILNPLVLNFYLYKHNVNMND